MVLPKTGAKHEDNEYHPRPSPPPPPLPSARYTDVMTPNTTPVQVRERLDAARKAETARIEERKNSHIERLMKAHEKAFAEIKNYYNDITHNNLDLIRSLKEEVRSLALAAKLLSFPLHLACILVQGLIFALAGLPGASIFFRTV